MVQSDDPKALDEAEKMVRMLAQPPRGTFVQVYPLTSADAFDMATMIDDIINPPRSSGFGFFGSEETDEEKAQRARITSDSRMNALIVTGPQAAHQKVKELLKILDIESPETDVKSAPRVIQIKYKSAETVAEQLRSQYATEVYQAPQNNQQQQQQGGPGGGGFGRFGFFGGGGFGGGGGSGRRGGGGRNGGGGAGESRGKIVITADPVSNTVLVTAAKPKFDEIESLAKELDNAAANAKQTVRVLTLKHTNTETMRKMLQQMYGVESTEAQPTGPGGGGRPGQGMGSGFQGGRGPGGRFPGRRRRWSRRQQRRRRRRRRWSPQSTQSRLIIEFRGSPNGGLRTTKYSADLIDTTDEASSPANATGGSDACSEVEFGRRDRLFRIGDRPGDVRPGNHSGATGRPNRRAAGGSPSSLA